MRITLVPSSTAGNGAPLQFLTTVLLNDTVAIDAGCLGMYAGLQEQERVKHVLLSHTHIDHLASLPVFLNTVFTGDEDCVTVYGTETVLDCLRRDVFNDRVWPDFIRLSAQGVPYLKLRAFYPGRPVEVEGLRITPVEVNHVVPTTGFLVEDPHSAVVFSSDTGPTEAIWELANRTPNLKAVFLEVTFPDAQESLANVSKHLTPALFGREARKVTRPVPFIAVHIHPRVREQVIKELDSLGLPHVEVGRFGTPYHF